ncbi:hypothetical protein DFH09DRAFT_263761 [Mycena vulgaris]|nr:hypothetical protein DFH09DRAFT_263761 [Mycena vulgaris]
MSGHMLPPIKTEAGAPLYRFPFAFTSSTSHPSSSSAHEFGGEYDAYAYGDGNCACRTHPGMAHAYIALAQALQGALKHPPPLHAAANGGRGGSGSGHAQGCVLYRRMAELARVMQGTDPDPPVSASTASTSSTSTHTYPDPTSASSASTSSGSFHGGSPASFHSHVADALPRARARRVAWSGARRDIIRARRGGTTRTRTRILAPPVAGGTLAHRAGILGRRAAAAGTASPGGYPGSPGGGGGYHAASPGAYGSPSPGHSNSNSRLLPQQLQRRQLQLE